MSTPYPDNGEPFSVETDNGDIYLRCQTVEEAQMWIVDRNSVERQYNLPVTDFKIKETED